MGAVDRGERAGGWTVVSMLLVPAVTPFLVELVRRVAGHHAGPATRGALGLCAVVLAVGLRAPIRMLRPDQRRPDPDAASIWGVLGVFCLIGAIIYVINGSADAPGRFADPLAMRLSAALLGGLGLAALVGVVLHDRRRHPARAVEDRSPSTTAPPALATPSEAPGVAGEADGDGTDRGWWVGAAVGVVVAVLLLCTPRTGVLPQLHTYLAGTPPLAPLWAFVVDVATTATWVAGTVAFLRASSEGTFRTDPRDQLDAAGCRALDEAVRGDRPVDPALRPRLRATLVRELHQRRRGAWIWAALAFQALDEGVDDLVHHVGVDAVGTMRVVVGVLGLVVLPDALLARHRTARRLAAVERSE